ncbi:MAG TPA: hypothetical protein VF576_12000 [Rubricoccaceae bacterium]
MKVTIQPRVPEANLRHVVPPAYRVAAVALDSPEPSSPAEYSVLLFAHAPRDVVPSAPVRKALRRLGEPAPGGVIAVGAVFTEEALTLLAEAGARVLALRKARWTDESARTRQL